MLPHLPILLRRRAPGGGGVRGSVRATCCPAAFRAATVLVLALLGTRARAADDAPANPAEHANGGALLTLDPVRSSAEFEVKVLWLIGVHGRFGQVHGTIAIDPQHLHEVADARIEVRTITMRNHSYEEWVKSEEFFDAAKFPQIHFVSEPFSQDRLLSGGELGGTLSVRGVDRHIVLEVEPSACPDAVALACPVEASGSIHRSDFGMRSRRGTLSDKVELRFSIYLAPPPSEEAASR